MFIKKSDRSICLNIQETVKEMMRIIIDLRDRVSIIEQEIKYINSKINH
jgi:hypothetical protein